MDHLTLLRRSSGRPLNAAIVGVGEFGTSFLYRSGRAAGLRVPAGADGNIDRVVRAALAAGIPPDHIARCSSAREAADAWSAGRFVAVEDASLLMDLPLDVVVEATGSPEAAARVAAMAIAHGKHVGMVTKECDSVVGPILQARAADSGLICTAVDGDQPSLAMGLVSWARTLGLEVLCAGKASEYDFVFEPIRETVTAIGRTQPAPAMRWRVPAAQLPACIEERRAQLAGWPHRTVPDLCELGLIANATALKPDTPMLHAPVARTLELPDLLRPRQEGGILEGTGVVDSFNCLRRDDEISFAGGVFVVVRCDDPATWRVVRGKGIPVSEDGRCALLHNPVHLLGIEAPITLLSSVASGVPTARLTPVCDLYARTVSGLRKGSQLALGERHAIGGVEPLLLDAQAAKPAAPIPYYMAAGCELATDVPAGELLRREHIVPPADSMLWKLRDEQDARFFD